jgi:undecaprenyl diphosphate synthase
MKSLFEILKPGDPDRQLASALDPERLPAHVAVIMDGNGRWARQRRLPRASGHKAGMEPVRLTIDTCARLGIRYLSLYAFSVDNWKRPKSEVGTLWRLLRVYLRRELPSFIENGIRLNAMGRLEALPEIVQRDLEAAVRETAGGRGLQVNLAINYGGRAEMVDAVNRLIEQARRQGKLDTLTVDEEDISHSLYTAGQPDPDLLIRTSGEMRVSNFLLWQIAYAELYVTETLWPDFRRADLLQALLEYQKRERRFGGLSNEPVPVAEDSLVGAAGLPSK